MPGLAEAGLEGPSLPLVESINKFRHVVGARYQTYLDLTTRHTTYRWASTAAILFLYILRVYLLQGFYVITYGLAIYTLNLVIGFLSPLTDPEENDGTELPINAISPQDSEWKPFMRKVPEFKFWYVRRQRPLDHFVVEDVRNSFLCLYASECPSCPLPTLSSAANRNYTHFLQAFIHKIPHHLLLLDLHSLPRHPRRLAGPFRLFYHSDDRPTQGPHPTHGQAQVFPWFSWKTDLLSQIGAKQSLQQCLQPGVESYSLRSAESPILNVIITDLID